MATKKNIEEKNIEELLAAIRKTINWYYNVGCKSNDGDMLLEALGRLQGNVWYLTEFIGDKDSEYNTIEEENKIELGEIVDELTEKQQMPLRTAQRESKTKMKDKKLMEIKLKSFIKMIVPRQRQANITIQVMMQKISYLSKEKFQSKLQV